MMEVHRIVEQCYNRLPNEWKSHPWDLTEHGRKVLQSETELDGYLAAYGEMHIVKCRAALQNFPCRFSTHLIISVLRIKRTIVEPLSF